MLLWFFDYFCFFGSETERSRNNCKIISVVTSIYIINTRLVSPFARLTFALLYVLWTKFSLMLNSKKIRGSIWDLKQVKRWLKHYNAEFAVSDILHCFALSYSYSYCALLCFALLCFPVVLVKWFSEKLFEFLLTFVIKFLNIIYYKSNIIMAFNGSIQFWIKFNSKTSK